MSDIKKENLIWFLDELANAEDYQFEGGSLKIVVGDEQGNEGIAEVSVQNLAASAIQEITNLVEQNAALRAALANITSIVFEAESGLLENWFDKIHNAALESSKALEQSK
jgi:hypothetical protein